MLDANALYSCICGLRVHKLLSTVIHHESFFVLVCTFGVRIRREKRKIHRGFQDLCLKLILRQVDHRSQYAKIIYLYKFLL